MTVVSLGTSGSQFTRRSSTALSSAGARAVEARSTRVPEGLRKPRRGKRVRLRPREPFHDQEASRVSVVAVSG